MLVKLPNFKFIHGLIIGIAFTIGVLTFASPVSECIQITIADSRVPKLGLDYLKPTKYDKFIWEAAKKYDINYHALRAIAWQESNFNPEAVSNRGALGMFQLMPSTIEYLNNKYNINIDPMNPQSASMAAALYLKDLEIQLNHPELAIAAYYVGPGTIIKYDGDLNKLPNTKKYLENILIKSN